MERSRKNTNDEQQRKNYHTLQNQTMTSQLKRTNIPVRNTPPLQFGNNPPIHQFKAWESYNTAQRKKSNQEKGKENSLTNSISSNLIQKKNNHIDDKDAIVTSVKNGKKKKSIASGYYYFSKTKTGKEFLGKFATEGTGKDSKVSYLKKMKKGSMSKHTFKIDYVGYGKNEDGTIDNKSLSGDGSSSVYLDFGGGSDLRLVTEEQIKKVGIKNIRLKFVVKLPKDDRFSAGSAETIAHEVFLHLEPKVKLLEAYLAKVDKGLVTNTKTIASNLKRIANRSDFSGKLHDGHHHKSTGGQVDHARWMAGKVPKYEQFIQEVKDSDFSQKVKDSILAERESMIKEYSESGYQGDWVKNIFHVKKWRQKLFPKKGKKK